MNTNEIVGYLKTYDKKGEGDQIMGDSILIEITEANKDGSVEFAYMDRNERVYVQLKLQDLLAAALAAGITS